jgi:transketolase
VVNVSTLKPLDVAGVVAAAKKCGAVVTAEEHSIIGGLGSAVAEALGENYPCPMVRVGVKDVFGQSGTPSDLILAYGLNPENIEQAAMSVMARK